MHTNDRQSNFADSLSQLLKRYCPEPVLKTIQGELEAIRTAEAQLFEKAGRTNQDAGIEQSILETGHLENILTECGHNLPKREYLALLLEIGALCRKLGEYTAARTIYTLVIELADAETRSAAAAGTAYAQRADIYIRQARWTNAIADLKRGALFFRKAKDNRGLAQIENSLGTLAAEQGDIKNSTKHFRKAQIAFEKAGDSERANAALMNLGILATICGEWDDGLSCYQRVLPQFEKLGQVSRLAEIYHNLGMLFLGKGDAKAAINQFDESLNHSRMMQYQSFIGLAFLGKSAAYARLGDFPLSAVFADRALAIFRQLNDYLSIADTYKVKGIIHRELGNAQIAELYFKTSLRLNEEYHNPLNLGETQYELGLLYRRIQQTGKAQQSFKKAISYFKKLGAANDLRNAQDALAAAGV